MENKEVITVRHAAQLLDVGISTLKRWADMEIIKSFRTAGGHRRFRLADVERFKSSRGQPSGSPEGRWVDLIRKEKDPLIVSAELLRARARLGSWWRVADEVGGALHELGRRWETGEISVIEEHLASERLARAVQWAAKTIQVAPDAPACLLAMAPKDEHTLGLSLAELTLHEGGWASLWAGRRTPMEDIMDTIHHREVQMVLLSASCILQDADALDELLGTISSVARVAGVQLVAGGLGAWPDDPDYGHRLHTFEELHRLLKSGRVA